VEKEIKYDFAFFASGDGRGWLEGRREL